LLQRRSSLPGKPIASVPKESDSQAVTAG